MTTPLTEGKEIPPEFIEEKVDTETDHPGMVKNPEYVKVMKHLEDVLDVGTLLIAIMIPNCRSGSRTLLRIRLCES